MRGFGLKGLAGKISWDGLCLRKADRRLPVVERAWAAANPTVSRVMVISLTSRFALDQEALFEGRDR
jgi:hypothetical protein